MSSSQFKNPASNLPAYFTKLSVAYPKSTGRSTQHLFSKAAPRLATVTSESVIHDNASGPATATGVLLSNEAIASQQPKIICTDMVPAMVSAVKDLANERGWSNVEALEMKSDDELTFQDNYFTHSITNFSIFNFSPSNRNLAAGEIYRTLKPGGQVIVTTWKRFGPGDVIHEAQRRIRPDLPLMKLSGPEMYDGQAVVDVLVAGGFEKHKLEIVEEACALKGDDLEGVLGFMKGDLTKNAREGWEEDEEERWAGVVDKIVSEECDRFGGMKVEMYAVIGTK